MSKTVKRHVHVFNPETGETEVLQPGMKVPAYATDQVTNPKVFEKVADAEEPVNEAPVPSVDDAQVVDGATVGGPAPDDTSAVPVNETVNANPAQRDTADQPGGNQAPKDGELAPADDPDNPASGVGAADAPPVAPAPAKKTAAPRKTAAKKTAAKKTAAK